MNKKIILCGVGNRCKEIYPFIKYVINKKQNQIIYGAIDINPNINDLEGIPVWRPGVLDKNVGDEEIYLITVKNKDIINFYKERLKDRPYIVYENIQSLTKLLNLDNIEISREYCAYSHINNMDEYFVEAEEQASIDLFWSKNSIFKKMFNQLDDSNIIELACGRGRHVEQYIEHAGNVTLVDILQKNIDICRERFKNHTNINYYRNNGFDLHDLVSESYSAIFCYDAMVHFELLDINEYLKDIFRVLNKGGKALLHHSNYDAFYNGTFESGIHGRAFMNYKIFAYLAFKEGFHVLNQEIINWGEIMHLDCITLLEKPF